MVSLCRRVDTRVASFMPLDISPPSETMTMTGSGLVARSTRASASFIASSSAVPRESRQPSRHEKRRASRARVHGSATRTLDANISSATSSSSFNFASIVSIARVACVSRPAMLGLESSRIHTLTGRGSRLTTVTCCSTPSSRSRKSAGPRSPMRLPSRGGDHGWNGHEVDTRSERRLRGGLRGEHADQRDERQATGEECHLTSLSLPDTIPCGFVTRHVA